MSEGKPKRQRCRRKRSKKTSLNREETPDDNVVVDIHCYNAGSTDPDPNISNFEEEVQTLRSNEILNGNDVMPHDDIQRVCVKCEKVFKSNSGLKYHLDKKVCQADNEGNGPNNTNPTLVKKELKKKSPKKERKKRLMTSDIRGYSCPSCGKNFTSSTGLNYHSKHNVCSSIKNTGNNEKSSKNIKSRNGSSRGLGARRRKNSNTELSTGQIIQISRKNRNNEADLDSNVSRSGDDRLNDFCNSDEKLKNISTNKTVASNIYSPDEHIIRIHGFKRRDHFEQLQPGSLHITKFGVVKIIADNRLPLDFCPSKLPKKASLDRYDEKLHAFLCRKRAIADEMYRGGRYRRERLNHMYINPLPRLRDSIGINEPTDVVSNNTHWNMYCHSVTTYQILRQKISWKSVNDDLKEKYDIESLGVENPHFPSDFFPNRIVECVLVKDERNVRYSKDGEVQHYKPTPLNMSLFLARKEIIASYNQSDSNYICSLCRSSFCDGMEWKYHVENNICTKEMQKKRDQRNRRLETIEEYLADNDVDMESFLSRIHATLKPKAGTVEFGNPCKIKQFKKHKMPSWIVFNEQHSPMYPELFIALQYKRGSQNRNWAGKKRQADDRVPPYDVRRNRKRVKRQTMKNEKKSSLETMRQIHEFALQQTAVQESFKRHVKKRKTMLALPTTPSSNGLDSLPPTLPSSTELIGGGDLSPNMAPLHGLLDISPLINPFPGVIDLIPPLPSIQENLMDDDFSSQAVILPRDDLIEESRFTPSVSPSASKSMPKDGIGVIGAAKRKNKKKSSDNLNQKSKRPRNKKSGRKSSLIPPSNDLNPIDATELKKTIQGADDSKETPLSIVSIGEIRPDESEVQIPNQSESRGVKVFNKGNLNPVVIDTQVLAMECDSGRYPTINRFDGVRVPECVLCTRVQTDEDDPLMECDFCQNSAHQLCINKRMLNKEPPIIMRESEPHDSVICHDCIANCLARRSRAESRRVAKWHYELSKIGLVIPDAAILAEEVDIQKAGGTDTSDAKSPTYAPCPNGGPGGLICCSHCTAAYSRHLSNTAKEIEIQSISKAGQEVSEILDLLADAKQRLLDATGVNTENTIRRKLLKKNEV